MTRDTVAQEREITFDDVPDISLELEVVPRRSPGFVTGAMARNAPEIAACPYCGTPGWADTHASSCAQCGAPLRATQAPLPPPIRLPSYRPLPLAPPLAAASGGGAFVEAVASVPFGFWKRLPTYAFLSMVHGNGCLCGGLSGRSNVFLGLLVVVGLVGVVVSLQRSP